MISFQYRNGASKFHPDGPWYLLILNIEVLNNSFEWNGKYPNLRKVLQRLKSVGGLAPLNFESYHWPSNIRCMLYWRHCDQKPPPV